jgi:uncharacterized protein YbcI
MSSSSEFGPPDVPGRPESDAGVAISRELTMLIKDYIGRGPTHAQSFVTGDLIVCVFEGELTKVERSLAALGREGEVREIRHMFQGALRDQAIAAVERVTSRRVSSFMSDNDVGGDLGVQIFVLEPGAEKREHAEAADVGAVGGSLDRATE